MLTRALERRKKRSHAEEDDVSCKNLSKTSALRMNSPNELPLQRRSPELCLTHQPETVFTEESMRQGLRKWLRQDIDLKYPQDKLRLGAQSRSF